MVGNPALAEINIHFRISWRKSHGYPYNDTTIRNGTLIGGDSMTCFSGCSGNVGSLQFVCTDYNDNEDWATGRNTITYAGCCWISTLNIGADGNWRLQTTVDMSTRTDTGLINRFPTVKMAPIVDLLSGCTYTIQLPVASQKSGLPVDF
ncbi:hypothetical protein DPMN_109578 [Dreissena polymorpha]|uniref:Uncharacterized protein n=1 Tax=Dreissena polymorpha TaxID=45954 RepID=A0A9D4KAY0_DREPO|nr:hypothetical protein DPMN_109578 [Dreissena polymorpha]